MTDSPNTKACSRNRTTDEDYASGVLWLESNRDRIIADRPAKEDLAVEVSEGISQGKIMAVKTLERMLNQIGLKYRARSKQPTEAMPEANQPTINVFNEDKMDRIITLLEALCEGFGCNTKGGAA